MVFGLVLCLPGVFAAGGGRETHCSRSTETRKCCLAAQQQGTRSSPWKFVRLPAAEQPQPPQQTQHCRLSWGIISLVCVCVGGDGGVKVVLDAPSSSGSGITCSLTSDPQYLEGCSLNGSTQMEQRLTRRVHTQSLFEVVWQLQSDKLYRCQMDKWLDGSESLCHTRKI